MAVSGYVLTILIGTSLYLTTAVERLTIIALALHFTLTSPTPQNNISGPPEELFHTKMQSLCTKAETNQIMYSRYAQQTSIYLNTLPYIPLIDLRDTSLIRPNIPMYKRDPLLQHHPLLHRRTLRYPR